MLYKVIAELVDEKGLDQASLQNIICEGILAAYLKKYPDQILRVIINKKTEAVQVESEKTVVASVQNPMTEIIAKKAVLLQKGVMIGDKIWTPFEEPIG